MSKDVNVIVIEGGLTKDPELKYTADGTALSKFSIANNDQYVSGGEKKESVSYFDITAWGKLAEVCTQYLKKGSRVIITQGRLIQRSWKAEDGTNRSAVSIKCEDIKFLTPKSKE